MKPDSSSRAELFSGMRLSLPVVFGYIPLGFAFGVLAVNAGMTPLQAVLMSTFCFTGSGQYVAVGAVQLGAPAGVAIAANLLINLRYFLFSTSLVPSYKDHVPVWAATLLSYGLTDETYAVAANRYRTHAPTLWFMGGLHLSAHAGWIISTFLGAALGALMNNPAQWGFDFALPAMYTCLLVLMCTDRLKAFIAVFSALLCLGIGSLFPATLPNWICLIIATLIAATVGVFLHERH